MIYKFVDFSCFIFDMFILIISFDCILQKRKNIPNFLFVGTFFLSELLMYGITIITNHYPFGLELFVTTFLSILSIFLLTFFYDSLLRYRILVTLLLQTFFSIAEHLSYAILCAASGTIAENTMISGLLYSKCIMFILVMIMRIIAFRKKQEYTVHYSLLNLIMPVITIFVLYALPYPKGQNTLPLPVHIIAIVGLLFLNIINFYLLNDLLQINTLKQTKLQLQEQIHRQSDNYQQISAAYRNTRSAIHDAKKHFFYVQECVRKKQYDEIIPYLETSIDGLEKSYNRINTGNLVIDSFVSAHLKIAEEEGIQLIPDIQIQPCLIPIKDYDLCIIIGNLLENALNSVRKIMPPVSKQIEVHIFIASHTFVINIKNTFVPAYQNNKTAQEQLYHGYGLQNVQNIAEKYGGTFVTFDKDEFYHVVVTVPLNDHI